MNKASYDDIASWYDDSLEAGPISRFHDLVMPTLLDLAGDVRGLRVCDLACGQGILSRRLADLGARVTGVDLSFEMVELARKYEEAEPRGISYIQGNAEDLDGLPDASFDLAACNLSLMDIPDLRFTFEAVHRVLRPGGRFVFSVIHPCFLTPGSPRWIYEEGQVVGMDVRRYFEEGYWRKDDVAEGIRGRVGSHHRTLATYLNGVVAADLELERVAEPRATGDAAEYMPGYHEVPGTLVVRCGKSVR